MKKINIFLLLILFIFTLAACDTASSSSEAPKIEYDENYLTMSYAQNTAKINLTKGLIATDDKDGNITMNIQCDYHDFDISKVGTYQIDFYVLNSNGVKSNVVTKTIIVTKDIHAPIVSLSYGCENLTIQKGNENYDLMEGLSAIDAEEGYITERIEMNKNGFDVNTSGAYTIEFYVYDKAGNKSNIVTKNVVVLGKNIFAPYEVYTDTIKNEVPKLTSYSCFPGDWSYTIRTSTDYWTGIETYLVLPKAQITRYQDNANDSSLLIDPSAKNLDNPSIYLGGDAEAEYDVGLTMSLVSFDGSSLSKGSFAFRPFWRYITDTDFDLGSYADHDNLYGTCQTGGWGNWKNIWGNWNDYESQYYYLPGDELRMICYSPKTGYSQLLIEVIKESTDPETIAIRNKYGWKSPEDFTSPLFSTPGAGSIKSDYKRVNAIDQVANEGLPTTMSSTHVFEMTWKECYLYRKIDGKMYRVPLDNSRAYAFKCPKVGSAAFIVSGVKDKGYETVEIKTEGVPTT